MEENMYVCMLCMLCIYVVICVCDGGSLMRYTSLSLSFSPPLLPLHTSSTTSSTPTPTPTWSLSLSLSLSEISKI